MKFQCKFCKKRIEPRIELDERSVTQDQKTYFCSLCGKQLFVLGGFWDKPFWRQPYMIGLWLSPDLVLLIELWESFKSSFKGNFYKTLLFLGMSLLVFWALSAFGIFLISLLPYFIR